MPLKHTYTSTHNYDVVKQTQYKEIIPTNYHYFLVEIVPTDDGKDVKVWYAKLYKDGKLKDYLSSENIFFLRGMVSEKVHQSLEDSLLFHLKGKENIDNDLVDKFMSVGEYLDERLINLYAYLLITFVFILYIINKDQQKIDYPFSSINILPLNNPLNRSIFSRNVFKYLMIYEEILTVTETQCIGSCILEQLRYLVIIKDAMIGRYSINFIPIYENANGILRLFVRMKEKESETKGS